MADSLLKIVFTGGGSAGHCVPNLALIKQMRAYCDIYYIGSNGIEQNLVADFNVPFYSIDCAKLTRKAVLKNLNIPFRLLKSIRQARKILLKIKPDLVFSKGGYVALPVVLAAHKLKITCLTHESDSSLGLANRLICKKCLKTLLAFENTKNSPFNSVYTGNPVRSELFNITKNEGKRRYGLDGRTTVLAFGGGSGSAAINEAIFACARSICKRYNLIHIVGRGNANGLANELYSEGYRQVEYEKQIEYAYAASDVTVTRAGANTLFELAALNKAAIVIPLSKATRGDQLENAKRFVDKYGFALLDEANLTSSALYELINIKAASVHNAPQTQPLPPNKLIIDEILKAANKTLNT